MTVRLTLVCAAAPTGREVRFGDAPLDERALLRARTTGPAVPGGGVRYRGPSQRCRATAAALAWDGAVVEPALRDLDMGRWDGRTLDEVAAGEPAALAAWAADPEAAPHGGESVAELCGRIAAWLDALPEGAGRVAAVVEQAVARAAVLGALSAPYASFWRVDVAPLAAVELTGRAGRWNLRWGAAGS
ncbi:broad specificity phosphatase PhoE [Streptomyces sp. SAI-170]|uniref:histidine phosphatase family protein n=1 Tax=Streptomyces sp. SAI-170 TaxID=3377729 RepID=UPI003C7DFC36